VSLRPLDLSGIVSVFQRHVGPEGGLPPARVSNRSARRARDQPALTTVRADAIFPDEPARSSHLHRSPIRRRGIDPHDARHALVAEAAGVMRDKKQRDSLFGGHPDPSRSGRIRKETKATPRDQVERVSRAPPPLVDTRFVFTLTM